MAKKPKTESDALNGALDKFVATMGEGVIHSADDSPDCLKIKSSVPMYNYITDGGFPVNRMIEHVGPEGSLKSYLAYDAIGKFQHFDWSNLVSGAFTRFTYESSKSIVKPLKEYKLRRGYKPAKEPLVRRVALIDVESTYTPDWGKRVFNIDNEGLILSKPAFLSDAVDITQTLLADETICLVVFDSLSATGPDDEIDSSMGDQQMASNARFWSKAFRKFQSAMNKNPNRQVTLIFMNNFYSKVGFVMGNPNTIKNGDQVRRSKSLSVQFHASTEIDGKTDFGDIKVGKNITVTCLKNKTGHGGRKGNFFYAYTDYQGTKANCTDVPSQLIDLAIRFDIVDRKGAWYQYKDVKVQGIEPFAEKMVELGLLTEIETELYATI